MTSNITNPLHRFVSYNYKWRFAALTQSEYNTGNTDFNSGIGIIETGGFEQKQAFTAVEQALGVSVEFFLDDVEMEFLSVPNAGTGFSNVLQFSFTITEPYSVGLFFQTLATTASQTGFQNYLQTPFLLANQFIGYDDAGNSQTIPGGAWCLKLTDLRFSVDASGSVYEVQAISYNHQAFTDTLQQTRTNTGFSGFTVKTVLDELFVELNRQQYQLQTQGQVGQPNAYRIEFPNDVGDISGGTSTYQASLQAGVDVFREQATQDFLQTAEAVNFGLSPIPSSQTIFGDPRREGGQTQLRIDRSRAARAQADPNANDIGNAPIANDFGRFGNNKFGENSLTWNAEKQLWQRGGMSISDDTRQFFFPPGMHIERIIEEVILTSEYGLRLTNQEPVDEMIEWFKITSKVYIADPYETQVSGAPAYEIVYIVTPYAVHRSHVMQGNSAHTYNFALQNARKTYRYSYTGENADIMDFVFNIDNSFYKDITGTQNNSANIDAAGNRVANQKNNVFSPTAQLNAGTPDITTPNRYNYTQHDTVGGANIEDNAVRVARVFNQQILNSDVDNIELELKIWGDPYYLTDSDSQNVSTDSFYYGIDANNHADWMRGEVYVLLDFKSAVDYNGNLLQIDPVNQFIGVYRLTQYRCNFENGIYSNTLKLLRMPGQQANTIQATRQILNGINVNNNLILANSSSELAQAYAPLMQKAQEFQEAYSHFQNLDIENLAKIAPGNLGQVVARFDGLINDAKQLQNNLEKTAQFLQNPIQGIETIAKNFASGIENQFKNTFGGLFK